MTDTQAQNLDEIALNVTGMNCASCVSHVQKAAIRTAGVQACDVNLARGRAVVKFDPKRTDPGAIASAISRAGYPAEPESAGSHQHHHDQQMLHARGWFRRAVIGIILWFPIELTHWILNWTGAMHEHGGVGWINWVGLITSSIAIAYVGSAFYASAWAAMKRLTTNMDTLIAMGASVAWGYSAVAMLGYLVGWWIALPHLYFMEATGLLALISLGHWMESHARQSAGSAIRQLLELAPAVAMRRTSDADSFEEVSVAELHVDDVVLIRPGDHVPIDGIVIDGHSSVNESMLTGEPLPVTRQKGDSVFGGTQNLDGRLIVRVAKTGADTALAQIVKLVEHAQSSKPAIQRLADRVAAVFVPSVLAIALITGIAWYVFGNSDPATKWGQIALAVCSVLIIACPCALGLAVPAALMVGTGRGARKGILIRDIDALQRAEKLDMVVLDKTGTITQGRPTLARVESLDGLPEDEVLRVAAGAEQFSEHPIAKAIVAASKQRGLRLEEPTGFRNEPGYGVVAETGAGQVLVGSLALMTAHDPSLAAPQTSFEHTTVHVGRRQNGRVQLLGSLHFEDPVKPDSVAAVAELHKLGLRTALLTGDNQATAEVVARQAGIDDVRAQVKPDQKAAVIRELQSRPARVAMVGDGINDAPALAQADLSIAMGSGSDIAKQSSDIVLVGASLHGIATALRLSRATMTKIRQNLFFAFIYNVLAIPLAAFGLLNPYIAAAAMALSDVTVIGNALLLRRSKID